VKNRLTQSLLIGTISNILEWYDFAVFGYLSLVIGKLFLPSANESISINFGFLVVASGFVLRPFGGLIFGYIGDKFGRKSPLFISLFIAAIPTCLIGLLPTYRQIGLWAPFLLITLRALQGLGVAGQLVSSMLYITEQTSENKRGFYGSWIYVGAGLGFVLGSFVVAVTSKLSGDEILYAWSWRLPFLSGALTFLFGLYVWSKAPESILFEKHHDKISRHPIRDMILHSKYIMIVVMSLGINLGVWTYINAVYLPVFLVKVANFSTSQSYAIVAIASFFLVIATIIGGFFSDYIGIRRTMLLACIGQILLAYPIMLITSWGYFGWSIFAQIFYIFLLSFYIAPLPAVLTEFAPISIRSTTVAFSHSFSTSIFGGTAALVAFWLTQYLSDPLAVAYYLSFTAMISGLGVVAVIVHAYNIKNKISGK
jgi:MHS family proline/betaine transporter-like MFS transporter